MFVLVLTSVSGAYAQSIEFTDGFEGSALDPFWNANVQQGGSITFPSTVQVHSGSQSVEFDSVYTGGSRYQYLIHNFSEPTYGDASVWVYDTGAGLSSGNYLVLQVGNNSLQNGDYSYLGGVAVVFTQDYDLPGNGDTYNWGGTTNDGGASTVYRTQAWHLFNIDNTASSLTMSVRWHNGVHRPRWNAF